MKVVVVGARRRRQGIGPFIARFFNEAGARVCGVVGTSTESARAARDELCEQDPGSCRAYTMLERALEEERPDVVAVCSPYAFHREALQAIASFGAHCLCEKPLWWEPHPDRVAETERLVDAFVSRGLHLDIVTQWPHTLDDYFAIYPELRDVRVERFDMRLSPISRGHDMVPDAAPHLLSMLQALAGSGDIVDGRAHYLDDRHERLCLDFAYRHERWDGKGTRVRATTGKERVGRKDDAVPAAGSIAVSFQCIRCLRPPRPAAFAVNDRWVQRRIELPDYRILLVPEGPGAEIHARRIEDPLKSLVTGFVERVQSLVLTERERLIASIRGLESLVRMEQEAKTNPGDVGPPPAG